VVHTARSLDAEQPRAVEEGLSDSELDLFDLLYKENSSKTDRERVKQASRQLLAALMEHLGRLEQWTAKEQTQAEVRIFIVDRVYESLPNPPFSDEERENAAQRVYESVWAWAARSRTGQAGRKDGSATPCTTVSERRSVLGNRGGSARVSMTDRP
jgi:type I restriction enzyme R subunit